MILCCSETEECGTVCVHIAELACPSKLGDLIQNPMGNIRPGTKVTPRMASGMQVLEPMAWPRYFSSIDVVLEGKKVVCL